MATDAAKQKDGYAKDACEDSGTHYETQEPESALIQENVATSLESVAQNASPADPDVFRAIQIVRTPAVKATARRYEVSIRMYEEILHDMQIDPANLDTSGTRDRENDPVAAALKLINKRCSPKEQGENYEGLSAAGTGTACKSAVVAFWRAHGYFANYTEYPDGSFSGNPGTCPAIQNLLNKMQTAQLRNGTHIVSRAYQETHEDVITLCEKYFDPFIVQALDCDPSVDYLKLQSAVINCLQFGAVARSDEVLFMRFERLVYSGDTPDSSKAAIIPVTKSRRNSDSFLVFDRAVCRGFCPVEKLLLWQGIMTSHGIASGPLFVTVSRNKLLPNRALHHPAYAKTFKDMSKACGLPQLQEHSARRGGLGYQYFVLRRDLLCLYHAYAWDDMSEMMKYLGLEDEVNSYALLGFCSLRINEAS